MTIEPAQKFSVQEITQETSYVDVNVGQHYINTTEDKIRLCLNNKIEELSVSVQNKGIWIAPLGNLITIILVFVSTDFKDWFLVKEVWSAIFTISAIGMAIWLLIAVLKAYSSRKKKTSDIVNSIIDEISGVGAKPNPTTSQETSFSDQI